MARSAVVLGLAAFAVPGAGQVPDLSVKLDLAATYRDNGSNRTVRLFDPFGGFSSLSFRGTLETGFRFTVVQKLQRARQDGEADGFEEYYLEDEGIWRLGKQFLPFGRQSLYREAALAARGEATLFFEGLPFQVALVDAGKGRQSGVIGRVGEAFGLSAAFGRHFGIHGTSFALTEELERGRGRGSGYRQMLGADYAQRIGSGTAAFEYLSVSQGERPGSPNRQRWDLSYRASLGQDGSVLVGVTWLQEEEATLIRFRGSIPAGKNLVLEPYVRSRDGKAWDGGLTMRVKL